MTRPAFTTKAALHSAAASRHVRPSPSPAAALAYVLDLGANLTPAQAHRFQQHIHAAEIAVERRRL